MNFKAINKHFGAQVHVWGMSGYTSIDGTFKEQFAPVKRLREFAPVARSIRLVAQDYSDPNEFYHEDIATDVLFGEQD